MGGPSRGLPTGGPVPAGGARSHAFGRWISRRKLRMRYGALACRRRGRNVLQLKGEREVEPRLTGGDCERHAYQRDPV
jgi:hypothetical protein